MRINNFSCRWVIGLGFAAACRRPPDNPIALWLQGFPLLLRPPSDSEITEVACKASEKKIYHIYISWCYVAWCGLGFRSTSSHNFRCGNAAFLLHTLSRLYNPSVVITWWKVVQETGWTLVLLSLPLLIPQAYASRSSSIDRVLKGIMHVWVLDSTLDQKGRAYLLYWVLVFSLR